MADKAKKDGLNIYILSAFRDFEYQKNIWEAKFSGKRKVKGLEFNNKDYTDKQIVLKILEYSSMPGASRHHWGTDFDISFSNKNYSLNNQLYESGEGKKLYLWLSKNAIKFGFCQPYKDSPESRSKEYNLGYFEEKWHWSYKPIAVKYQNLFKKNMAFLKPKDFSGDLEVKDIYPQYILNIHNDCLN